MATTKKAVDSVPKPVQSAAEKKKMTRKEKCRAKFQGFKLFLYNPADGRVCGRNGWEWLRVTIFYVIFFSCLFSFLIGMIELAGVFCAGGPNRPKSYGPGSLIFIKDSLTAKKERYGLRLKLYAPNRTDFKVAGKGPVFFDVDGKKEMVLEINVTLPVEKNELIHNMRKVFQEYTIARRKTNQLNCSDPQDQAKHRYKDPDTHSCFVPLERQNSNPDGTTEKSDVSTGPTAKDSTVTTTTTTPTKTTTTATDSTQSTSSTQSTGSAETTTSASTESSTTASTESTPQAFVALRDQIHFDSRESGGNDRAQENVYSFGDCECNGTIDKCEFGFDKKKPCIAFAFNKMINWIPDDKEVILTVAEKTDIKVNLFPEDGKIPSCYFPYPGKSYHYLEPFFMVQLDLKNVTSNKNFTLHLMVHEKKRDIKTIMIVFIRVKV